ncbi:DNA translocase FtsK [Anianabacter salinae]|uniref:DNA translocase FtsK n=1 Tax=Anianabacter salinae TaxID=2851023 RepID=UPI00225E11D7|nr:DNA translocase FtsK [Anianabacter salinae]MBV0913377.1 DNA translocase FtsK 4TM domain-containing protein [Anianabacter salinae]
MASYQVRQRERLFDSSTQEVIEKRGRELIGLVLLTCGVALSLILGTYSVDDPSWLSVTDTPAQNALGRFGASVASPLYIIVGFGCWAFAAGLLAWGLRFVLHAGAGRFMSRIVFLPLAVALLSVYASTHVPSSDWTHSFGLGGLFGDTVLGAILGVLPVDTALGLKVLAFFVAVFELVLVLFVLGFVPSELRALTALMLGGAVLFYAAIRAGLGAGVVGGVKVAGHAAGNAQGWMAARRSGAEDPGEDDPFDGSSYGRAAAPRATPILRADPPPRTASSMPPAPEPAPAQQKGPLGLRLPGLLKRAEDPAPQTWEPEPYDEDLTGDDRIKAKIAGAIKSRMRPGMIQPEAPRFEPSLTRGRGPQPMVLKDIEARARAAAETAGDTVPAAAAEPLLRGGFIPPAPDLIEEDDEADIGDFDAQDTAFNAAPRPEMPPRPPVSATPEARRVVQTSPRKALQTSRRAQAEAQPSLRFEDRAVEYELPPLSLLMNPSEVERHHLSDEALEENARMLETVLDDYGVKGEIVSVRPGPVVTMYELEPAPGLKASRVIGLADDIARSMSALSARVSTVPGRSVIGIELPNENREMVCFREILSSRDYGDGNQKLPLALGKDIGGDPVVANLAKMPHLLIAGTTGSGKSVAINTMILSLLYKLSPEECRLIMIDPKMLELSVYDGIPHLLSPVVTDPKKAVVALKWVVGEMEDRYRKMSKMGVRNIDGFNGRVKDALAKGEMFKRTVQTGFDEDTGEPIFETEEFAPQSLPYIVVVVDEMADLMMVAGKEIEACIQRLAQMARASGIHLIMATQRPSVDVITGTIKANFPTRISFQVTSKIDSRTILGEQGAEQLLGMGDMLYMAGGSRITRVHGPFVSDEEVEEIVSYLKSYGPPSYVGGVVEGPDEDSESDIDAVLGLNTGGNTDGEDALYDQAVAIVLKDRKCSTSYIQRKLAIGYNKAARLVEQMEENGLVSPSNHVGKREILVPEQG